MSKDVFKNSVKYEFEGCFFWGPKDYDKVLSRIYGDYQSLPPLEERKPHHDIIEVSFNL